MRGSVLRGSSFTPLTRRATVVLLVATLALSGCSGEDEPSAAPPTSAASPTESASPSETPRDQGQSTPRRPRRPPAKDTVGGRVAFARFVMASWSYALATNDARAVTSLSAKGRSCGGCKALERELAKRERQKWFVDFPGLTVKQVRVRRDVPTGDYVATARVDIPKSLSYFTDGSFRNENAPHRNATFRVRMDRVKNEYVLVSYEVALT